MTRSAPVIVSEFGAGIEIIVPKGDRVRSRRVVSRSRCRATGKYPSWKMGRMIQWESSHELNAFRLLDVDPSVLAYREQPLTIRFVLNGERHTHYPDVLVQWSGSRELWEIKPASEVLDPFFSARAELLEQALPSFGYQYRLIVGEELAVRPRLSNALELLKYGRNPISALDREHVRQILSKVPFITWASATNGDLGPNGRAVLSRLALEGLVNFDIKKPLTETRFEGTQTGQGASS